MWCVRFLALLLPLAVGLMLSPWQTSAECSECASRAQTAPLDARAIETLIAGLRGGLPACAEVRAPIKKTNDPIRPYAVAGWIKKTDPVMMGLSREERGAIWDYTTLGFACLNQALLFPLSKANRNCRSGVRALNRAIRKLPPYVGEVRRNVPGGRDCAHLYPIGGRIGYKVYASSSTNHGEVVGGPCRLQIHSKLGRSIRAFSFVYAEEEVIFLPGSKFLVTGKKNDGQQVYPVLEDVSDTEPQFQYIEQLRQLGVDYDSVLKLAEEWLYANKLDQAEFTDEELVSYFTLWLGMNGRITSALARGDGSTRFGPLSRYFESTLSKIPSCFDEVSIDSGWFPPAIASAKTGDRLSVKGRIEGLAIPAGSKPFAPAPARTYVRVIPKSLKPVVLPDGSRQLRVLLNRDAEFQVLKREATAQGETIYLREL